MKHLLLILMLLATITLASQTAPEGTVLVPGAELQVKPAEVQTNSPKLTELLQEFYERARFERIAYGKGLIDLKGIYFVKADLNFLGAVVQEGQVIHINEELQRYPYVLWIVFNNQLGQLLGLPQVERGHDVMSECWAIDVDHEFYATKLLRDRTTVKTRFFKALAKENPIPKRL